MTITRRTHAQTRLVRELEHPQAILLASHTLVIALPKLAPKDAHSKYRKEEDDEEEQEHDIQDRRGAHEERVEDKSNPFVLVKHPQRSHAAKHPHDPAQPAREVLERAWRWIMVQIHPLAYGHV